MFDHLDTGIGLWPGEGDESEVDDVDAVDAAYRLTSLALADGWVDEDRHVLPDGLDEIPVGPFLAAVVSSVDPARLNGHDAVRLMRARSRLSSHHEAGKLAAIAEVVFSPPSDADSPVVRSSEQVDYAAAEVGAGLCLTRRASERQLDLAVSLQGRLRRVAEVFSCGSIDLARTRVLDDLLGHLPDETVDWVLDRVLDDASGLTTGELRARVSRLVLEADPEGAASSFHEGLADRRVVTYPNPDLTGTLAVTSGDPTRIAAARAHIERLARHLMSEDEERTLDQLRHDVALDLLAGKCLHLRPSEVGGTHVTIPAETLAGLSNAPGELDGYGPVFAEIARKTARERFDGQWTFTVTDQGRPLATGTITRRPTRAQRRRVTADYPVCVFPGCRMPAYRCDLDHRRPFSQGGPTHNDNLGPLCRHHHMVRHHAPWQLERLPDGGHQWTSPLGHAYIRKRGPPR